jgi:hypothetical protein
MTGELPRTDIDHADGHRSNNRWGNLRECNRSENLQNSKKPKNNTAGFKGVTFDKKRGKWVARIKVGGHRLFLGYTDSPETAAHLYVVAAYKHFGDFARF